MKKVGIKLLAVLLNILVPGSGLLLIGYFRTALIVQTSLIGLLVTLCWTRLILSPAGILILIFGTLLIHVLSTILCLILKIRYSETKKPWLWKRLLASTLFVIASTALLVGSFFSKHHWLGIHIYFVPSMSMYPTLKPGQFILIDTWIYESKEPQVDDIVVFKHNNPDQWLVKRIGTWPTGELIQRGEYFMLGDNIQASQTSHNFGNIKEDQMMGKVKLILLGVDQTHMPIKNSFLKLVQ